MIRRSKEKRSRSVWTRWRMCLWNRATSFKC